MSSYTHRLREPLEYEDKAYTAITLDFDKLTGRDALAVEEELKSEGIGPTNFVHVEAYDGGYQITTAARASGIAKDVLLALPIRDVSTIKRIVRAYLVGGYTEIGDRLADNLDKMDGGVTDIIDNELRAEGHVITTDEALDTRYCIKLAAKALDTTENEIINLPMSQFVYVKLAVRFYLFGIDLHRRKRGEK